MAFIILLLAFVVFLFLALDYENMSMNKEEVEVDPLYKFFNKWINK